jgi:hypothetical protein
MSVNKVVDPNEIVDMDVESLGRGRDGDSFVRDVSGDLWDGEGPGCPAKDYVDDWEGDRDSYTFTSDEVGDAQRLFGFSLDDALGEHLIVHDPAAIKLGEVPFPSEPSNVKATLSADEVAAQAAKVDRLAAEAAAWIRRVLAKG